MRNNLGLLAVLALVATMGLVAYNTNGVSKGNGTSPAQSTGSVTAVNSPITSVNVSTNSHLLPEAKKQALDSSNKKVTKLNINGERTLLLLGQVGANALDVADALTALQAKSTEPIYLIITGPGGSVLTGANLIAAIQSSQAPVYTICSVICASMSAMIHQYGTERYVVDRTILMFHPASSGTDGDLDRMVSYSTSLQRYVNKMELDVAKRSKIAYSEYKAMVGIELWIDSEDSVAKNLADKIVSYNIDSTKLDMILKSNNKRQEGKGNLGIPNDMIWIAPWYKKDGK